MLDLLLGVLVFLCVVYVTREIVRRFDSRLPPGPWGLPVFGYTPFLSDSPQEDYCKLAKKYGPVFGIHNGSRYTVILGDFASIKEAFNKEEFLDRPASFNLFENNENIVSWSGWKWKETRRFVLSTFRTLGMGKNRVEQRIMEEVFLDVEKLEKMGLGTEVNTAEFFYRAFANTIFSIIHGLDLDKSEDILQMMHRFTSAVIGMFNRSILVFHFPAMNFIYSVLSIFGLKRGQTPEIDKYLSQQIDLHQRRFDPDNKDDFFDYYIEELRKNSRENTSFSFSSMLSTARMMLFVATETTHTTLNWTFLFLAKYPEIQEKVHRELSNLLGPEKPASWTDRDSLPYTNAFLMEVQRFNTVAPATDPHSSSRSGTVGGYHIPKGAVMLANVYAVHMDKTLWQDPENFRPERFISNEGKLFTPEYWMPFLIGKRMCPGEKLANMQLFLFTTSIVQKFKVLPPNSGLSMEGKTDGLYFPTKPVVTFRLRT